MSKAKVRKFYVLGYPVLVDDTDSVIFEEQDGAWCLVRTGLSTYVSNSKTGEYLHRLIMTPSPEKYVDHRNGNGLDNRRENLRVVTHFENCQNRQRHTTGSSGYIGVTARKVGTATFWIAQLTYNNRNNYLGYFKTKEEAALAYNEGIFRILPPHHAKLRKLNVIGEPHETKKVA